MSIFILAIDNPIVYNPRYVYITIVHKSLHNSLHTLIGGFNPSEKYEFVSWDDNFQYMGKSKNVPKHQPAMVYPLFKPPFGFLKSTNRAWLRSTSCGGIQGSPKGARLVQDMPKQVAIPGSLDTTHTYIYICIWIFNHMYIYIHI